MAKVLTQHGASLTLASSGTTLLLTSITPPSIDIGEVVITSHNTARNGHVEKMPGDLKTVGDVTATWLVTDATKPTEGSIEVMTVTSAAALGISAASWSGSAFFKSISFSELGANSNAPATATGVITFMGLRLASSGVSGTGTDLTYTHPS